MFFLSFRSAALTAALVAGVGCTKRAVSSRAVVVELYVMSQCPYGVQAESALKPALDALGADVDFHLEFIGEGSGSKTFRSLHGPSEIAGDIAQLCAAKHSPKKLMDMVACQNRDVQQVANNWEPCAAASGANVDAIRKCIAGDEGSGLLKASFSRSQERRAEGSPTLYIGGKLYAGARSARAFRKTICAAYGESKPKACAPNPQAPPVRVTVVGDKRCVGCNPASIIKEIATRVDGTVIRELDYSEPEAKELMRSVGATQIPLVLFDDSLKADKEGYESLSGWLHPQGKYLGLSVGATYVPACADPGACELSQCKSILACRPEEPGKVELFVMSECPYGMQALNAVGEVLANVKGIDLQVNYIAAGTAKGGFTSLHGPAEVGEDIRQLCAAANYRQDAKYLDYILCRNRNIHSSNWQACAIEGIDAKVLQRCAESEVGKRLLEENIRVASELAIGSSPTWIANGRYKFAALDAQAIKTAVCQKNPQLVGCDKTLSTGTGVSPGAGNCGN